MSKGGAFFLCAPLKLISWTKSESTSFNSSSSHVHASKARGVVAVRMKPLPLRSALSVMSSPDARHHTLVERAQLLCPGSQPSPRPWTWLVLSVSSSLVREPSVPRWRCSSPTARLTPPFLAVFSRNKAGSSHNRSRKKCTASSNSMDPPPSASTLSKSSLTQITCQTIGFQLGVHMLETRVPRRAYICPSDVRGLEQPINLQRRLGHDHETPQLVSGDVFIPIQPRLMCGWWERRHSLT